MYIRFKSQRNFSSRGGSLNFVAKMVRIKPEKNRHSRKRMAYVLVWNSIVYLGTFKEVSLEWDSSTYQKSFQILRSIQRSTERFLSYRMTWSRDQILERSVRPTLKFLLSKNQTAKLEGAVGLWQFSSRIDTQTTWDRNEQRKVHGSLIVLNYNSPAIIYIFWRHMSW